MSVSVSKPESPFLGSIQNGVVSVPSDGDFGAITFAKAGKIIHKITDRTLIRAEEGPKVLASPPTA